MVHERAGKLLIARAFGALGLGLTLMLAGAHLPLGRDFAWNRLVSVVRSRYGIEMTSSEFRYNLLRFTFDISELSLRMINGPADPMVAVDRVELNLGLWSLFSGVPTIQDAVLEGVGIRMGPDQLRALAPNVLSADTPPIDLGQFVRIESLDADGPGVVFADESGSTRFEVGGWQLAIRGLGAEHRIDLDVDGGRIATPPIAFDLDALTSVLVVALPDIRIESFVARSPVGSLDVSGLVSDPMNAVLDLDASLAIDIGLFLGAAGIDFPATGVIRNETQIRNGFEDLEIVVETEGTAVSVSPLPEFDLDGTWSWARATSRMAIDELRATSTAGSIRFEGEVTTAGTGPGALVAEVADLDLGVVTAIVGTPVRLGSLASGRVTASWDGLDWQNGAASAQMALDGSASRVSAGVLPVSGDLEFDLREGEVTARSTSLGGLGLVLDGEINLGEADAMSGTVRAAGPDLVQILESIATLTGVRPEWPLPADYPSGPLQLTMDLDGIRSQPVIDFDLELPDLAFGTVSGLALSTTGAYVSRMVRIESAEVGWEGQRVDIRGAVDLSVEPALIDLEARGQDVSPARVLEAFDIAVPVDGRFDFESIVGGSVDAPRVTAGVRGSAVTVARVPLGDLAADLRLVSDLVEVTELVLSPPSANGAGVVRANLTFQTTTGQFTLDAVGGDFDLSELLEPTDIGADGLLSFTVTGAGGPGDAGRRVDLTANVEDMSYGALGLGEVAVVGTLVDQQFDLRASVPMLGLTARSEVELTGDLPARVDLEIPVLDLAVLAPLLPVERAAINGSTGGALSANGDLLDWRSGRAQLDIAESVVTIRQSTIASSGVTRIAYGGGRLRLDPAVLETGGERLEVSGDVPIDPGSDDGLIEAKGRLRIAPILAVSPYADLIDAEGIVEVDLELRGRLTDLQPVLSARLRDGVVAVESIGEPIDSIEAELTVTDQRVDLDVLQARWNQAEISASMGGALALFSSQPDGVTETAPVSDPARFTAGIIDLDLATLPGMPDGLFGSTNIHIDLTAPSLIADAIEGRIELDALNGRFEELAFGEEQPTVFTIAGGRVQVESLSLSGPESRLEGRGSFGLDGSDPVDLDFTGRVSSQMLLPTPDTIRPSGAIDFDLRLGGTRDDPEPSGLVRLDEVGLSVTDPAIELAGLDALLELSPGVATLQSATGTLNGGDVTAGGSVRYQGVQIELIDFRLQGNNLFFEMPQGLRTLSSIELGIESSGDLINLTGEVEILEGSYTEDMDLEATLLDYVVSRSDPELLSDPDPMLSRLRYDIAIDTAQPLIVDNNVASAEAEANLQLVGSYYRPGLVGRVVFAEGGELQVRDTRFVLETGVVDFDAPNRISPSLDVVGRTEYRDYEVTILIAGGGTDLTTTLTSNPPLSEPNIVSLLLTGRTLNEVRGAELNVAREQALFYVTGVVGNRLTRSAEDALGLSRVRIEPNLIANESDPGARLTIGQDVTRDLELIYSMNLADSSDQIWIAEYGIGPRLLTRGVKQEDNSYRLEMRHDLTFGGQPQAMTAAVAPAAAERVLSRVRVTPPTFEGRDLEAVLDLDVGDRYGFLALREGTRRLGDYFADRGYLEARVRVDRGIDGAQITLDVEIDPGPRVRFEFVGVRPSGDTIDLIRQSWIEGGFDDLRGRRSIAAIRRELISDGYLEARAEYELSSLDAEKRVVFTVSPGFRYRRVDIAFSGVTAVADDELRADLRSAGLWDDIHSEPDAVREFLERRYRSAGYRSATVNPYRYEFIPEENRARLTIGVNEGPLYGISGVRLDGNRFFSSEALMADLALTGRPVDLALLDQAEQAIEERYWRSGFNDVVIERSLTSGRVESEMELGLTIQENARSVVGDVEVAGNGQTSERFVRSKLAFQPNQPLNFEQLNATRRNLYDTGAYSLVEIRTTALDPLEDDAGAERPVRVRLNLEEVAPYTFRYGGFYDTERGPGVIGDLRRQNLWGSSRVAGISGRYDGELHELRVYFSQPPVARLPAKTNVGGFVLREVDGVQTTDRKGVSIQQELGLGNRFLLSYGYRYENTHTVRAPDVASGTSALDERLNIAPLTLTLSRDTRDDSFDASSGLFISHSIEYASSRFGSDTGLFKYFGQAFGYLPLSAPDEVPFSGGRSRPRFVYASGVRFGFAVGLAGQRVAAAERFFSGGGTTVRGFGQDRLGPTDALGDPLGGNAVFTLNNEIRFPIYRIVEGVGFLDAGNVYSQLGGVDLFDLGTSGGFGLRVRTPYFLLRADYGLALGRRPADVSRGSFYFSIGQAF